MHTVQIISNFSCITRSPIAKYPFYMLIETSGSRMDHDEEKLNNFLQHVMESRLVLDGTVTNEPGKMKVLIKNNCLTSNSTPLLLLSQ